MNHFRVQYALSNDPNATATSGFASSSTISYSSFSNICFTRDNICCCRGSLNDGCLEVPCSLRFDVR